MPAPANPYIIGPPIGGDTGFFGREEIIRHIEQVLRYPPNSSVLVYGQRRSGKTSLLLQLERRLPDPPFFSIYFDLHTRAMLPVGTVLHQLATAAAAKAGMPPPDPVRFEGNPNAFHEDFLPALYQKLGPRHQPVFLLDEFANIDIPETELPETSAIRSLDTYLYHLITTQTHTDFVFAAGRRIEEFNYITHSSYKPSLSQFVTVLSPDDARELILQPGAPAFTDDAISRIVDTTRGQPYFTQLLCHSLVQHTAGRAPITKDDVKAALPILLAQDVPGVTGIWHSIPPAERLALAAAAGRSHGPLDVVSRAALTSTLAQADVPANTPGLTAAPQNLVNWQLFEQSGSGFTFFIDFFRQWVAHNRPLDAIKADELARLNGEAMTLYLAARRDFNAGRPDAALHKAEQATRLNSYLLPAHLLCGAIHNEKGELPEAKAAYEAAYKLSPIAAAGALAALLLKLGQRQAAAGDLTGAQAAYQRLLEISPGDEQAGARLQALQQQPGPQPPARTTAAAPAPPTHSRRWWPALLAIGLLLVLLLCAWLLNPALVTSPTGTATATAVAQASDTNTPPPATAMPTATPAIEQNAAATTAAGATPAPPTEQAAATQQATPAEQTAATQPPPATAAAGQIRVAGSAEMQPLLEQAALAFTAAQPNTQVVISGGSGQAALLALQQSNAELAVLSRNLTPAEQAQLPDAQVFSLPQRDPIAIITHPIVPLRDLSAAQVRDIFSGAANNWADVGGPNAPIVRVTREEGTDLRLAFEQQIMGPDTPLATQNTTVVVSDSEMRAAVASTPYAIGFVPAGSGQNPAPLFNENWAVIDTMALAAKSLTLDGAAPTAQNAANGSYPLGQPLNLIAPATPSPVLQAWLDFLLGPQGQQVIETYRQNRP